MGTSEMVNNILVSYLLQNGDIEFQDKWTIFWLWGVWGGNKKSEFFIANIFPVDDGLYFLKINSGNQ